MAYECKIILDSVAPNGIRLCTFQITFPRIILAELNTHRAFSRNSASSRAIPVKKMIAKVMDDPFIPIYWGKNQKGMQAEQALTEDEQVLAEIDWEKARDYAVQSAYNLLNTGVHKQIANRLLEPFLWHEAIVSATDYANFFAQRCHPDAQPEIRRIAEMMRDLYDTCVPSPVAEGQWHCPYLSAEDYGAINTLAESGAYGAVEPSELAKHISVARCARVSYLTQEGTRDLEADLALFRRLITGTHWSPFEHVARAAVPSFTGSIGNFRGWSQFRKMFNDENRKEYPHAN